jgi:hypothetical protein
MPVVAAPRRKLRREVMGFRTGGQGAQRISGLAEVSGVAGVAGVAGVPAVPGEAAVPPVTGAIAPLLPPPPQALSANTVARPSRTARQPGRGSEKEEAKRACMESLLS